ncbi:putative Peptidase A24A, prepilin type IV [metagenome]|uniref:Putative Peptidase A24A, prepilin type IV n=1 Tax=metagenome TaxID=256318 RepID=A0A2P2BY81_9ZZZZ
MHLDAALACALIGLAGGWFVPQLIRWVPEPEPVPEPVADVEAEPAPDPEPVAESVDPPASKELYADIAALPGLAWKAALASGAAAGVIGLVLGWGWPLAYLVFLAPVGVALSVIDFRTWLLPTKIIWPTYAVVLLLASVASVATGDYDALVRGLIGQAVALAVFFLLWFLPGGGMGFGDVRLSNILGLALGYLGWGEWAFGLWVGFLLGSLAWVPLRLLKLTTSRHFPFGPFMLLGALVGVLWGGEVMSNLVGGRS